MNLQTPAHSIYQQRITFSIEHTKAYETVSRKRSIPLFGTIQAGIMNALNLPGEEAFSHHPEPLVSSTTFQAFGKDVHGNAFFHAAFEAYCQHKPLVLNPDIVWLAICQGFALHLNQNPETWRNRLVSHEGKKPLMVSLVSTVLSDTKAWIGALAQMRKQIAEHTKENIADTIAARFSGTDVHVQATFDITLMLTVKSYFDYAFIPVCGIPEITLEGTTTDWVSIQQRFEHLASFGLAPWAKKLRPVLQEFTNASRGDINPNFWSDIISYHQGCGDVISGWLAYFFPCVLSTVNDGLAINPKFQNENYSLDLGQIPPGFTDLDVFNLGNESILRLKAGFAGVQKDEHLNGALRPLIGWSVYETDRMMSEADKNTYAELLNNLKQAN